MSLSIHKMAICQNAPIIDAQNDSIAFDFSDKDYHGANLEEFLKVINFAIQNGKYIVIS